MEPHDLDQDDFIAQVQSFEFWFEAVEGYLSDKPHGYDPDLPDPPLDAHEREALITTLCNYCVGEAAALEASSGLVRLAPNHHAQIFLAIVLFLPLFLAVIVTVVRLETILNQFYLFLIFSLIGGLMGARVFAVEL